MKLRNKLGCLFCAIAIILTSVCTIVVNSDKVAATNKESTYEFNLEKEAMKYVALEDVDQSTGRLKPGVIYNVGGDGVYLTSEGLVEYAVNQVNTGMTTVRNGKPDIRIIPSTTSNEILFSNNEILSFDVSYDESKLYVETKRNVLVSETYTESSHYETRGRLVWRSYRKKIWFAWVTIWYLAYEQYQEKVIVRTPIQTYQEQRSTALSVNLEDDSNAITKMISNIVDKHLPEVRLMSILYQMPLAIAFMDTILTMAKSIFLQILSIIAEFIPVIDEVKTSYETVFGKDLFTGEKIGTFWRIFGGITLAIGAIGAIFTFGASMAVADVAADAAQVSKKTTKLINTMGNASQGVKNASNAYDAIRSLDGFADIGGAALKRAVKYSDKIDDLMDMGIDSKSIAKLFENAKSGDALKSSLNFIQDHLDEIGKMSKKGASFAIENIDTYKKLIDKGIDVSKFFDDFVDVGSDIFKKVSNNIDKITNIIDKGIDSKTLAKMLGNSVPSKTTKLIKALDNNPNQVLKILSTNVNPLQLGKVIENGKDANKITEILDLMVDNIDGLKKLDGGAADIAIRHIDIYNDLAKKGTDVNKLFDDLANLKISKLDNMDGIPEALLDKVYKVDAGDIINNLDPTVRGTLLDDVLGNSVNDFTINGEKIFTFSDGSMIAHTPLGGSAPGCDDLISLVKNGDETVGLASRKSMDLARYSKEAMESQLDEYFETLGNYKIQYDGVQRTTETGLPKILEYGEHYKKLVLELDVIGGTGTKLNDLTAYLTKKLSDLGDLYDVIINFIK